MSVYFAQAGRYMKIGYSADPISRATTVTTSGKRPDDLPRKSPARLIGWVPGDRWMEQEVQARFRGQRIAGEWFAGIDEAEVRELIWADPCGIDIERMSAAAVFVACNSLPADVTRDEIAVVGVPIEASNPRPVLANLFRGGAA